MTENRIWTFGAAVVILGIIGLGWLLGISPKLAEADAATEARVLVDQENAAHAATLVVLREQFENLDELEKQLEELQQELPGEADVEGFIEYTVGVAAQAGVVISTITALESAPYGAGSLGEQSAEAPPADPVDPPAEGEATSSAPPSESGTPETTGLYSIGMSVAVEGSPEQVMAFSRLLQENKRIFLATQVTFDSGGAGILGGTISGHLFVLGSPQLEP